MDPTQIAIRVLVAYLYLLIIVRVSGKRVVAEATPFDFVVALILGDVIDDIVWAEVAMAKFATAAGSIVLIDIAVKIAAFHSDRFHRLVNGTPTIVVRDGEPDHRQLRREQLNDGDLAHLLRKQQVDDRSDVRIATLDQDHDLSVIRKRSESPVQRKDRDRVRRR